MGPISDGGMCASAQAPFVGAGQRHYDARLCCPVVAACGKSEVCSTTQAFGEKCGSPMKVDHTPMREKYNVIT